MKRAIGASTRFALLRLACASFFIGMVFSLAPLTGIAAAQSYTSPHGGFTDYTQFCQLCHVMHDAPGAKLERYMPESAVCFTCHNGTGSNYNTQEQMNADPATNAMHPIMVNLNYNPGVYNYTADTTAGIAPPGPYNCSQCHEPHGDVGYGKLLYATYNTNEYVPYDPVANPYNACWSCHSAATITNDETLFQGHKKHIIDHQASCSACHYSPHGVAFVALVKFNPGYVAGSVAGNRGPAFANDGNHHGSCTLTCHGEDHNQVNY